MTPFSEIIHLVVYTNTKIVHVALINISELGLIVALFEVLSLCFWSENKSHFMFIYLRLYIFGDNFLIPATFGKTRAGYLDLKT